LIVENLGVGDGLTERMLDHVRERGAYASVGRQVAAIRRSACLLFRRTWPVR
jgi:hypothetical protein